MALTFSGYILPCINNNEYVCVCVCVSNEILDLKA